MKSQVETNVVIVGGGVAGLFCARELAGHGFRVQLLEGTNRLGGRIETGDMRPGPYRGGAAHKAEFGPMRFELDIQPHFKALLEHFGIHWESFAPPDSPEPPVAYPLLNDERGKAGTSLSALELLKLGVYRLFHQSTSVVEEVKDGKTKARVQLSDEGMKWLASCSDSSGKFDELRQTAMMPGTNQPLHEHGFWNALYTQLSPMAVAKILHFGTFYHLMPDNPNAAEWAIFWLRLFRLGDKPLDTIPGGVDAVVTNLHAELDKLPLVNLELEQKVIDVRPTSSAADSVEVVVAGRPTTLTADHVILALPKQPLLALAGRFAPRIRDDLDAVIAFPLLKVFCVTDTPPWWKEDPPQAQEGAWNAPTREVHYLPAREPDDPDPAPDHTLVLFYTDRPATAYWQPYLTEPDDHQRAEVDQNPELEKAISSILFKMHLHWALRAAGVKGGPFSLTEANGREALRALIEVYQDLLADVDADSPEGRLLAREHPALLGDITRIILQPTEIQEWQRKAIRSYAIRDWSRPPFGAGCHAWAPGARSWEVRERLAGFGFEGQEHTKNLHICGEAYSDYQGFIEGALRSAFDTVGTIVAARDGRGK